MAKQVLLITALLIGFTAVQAQAKSQTLQFKLSVTIPAIIGFNVPDENQLSSDERKLDMAAFQVSTEEVLRGQEWIVLRTLVAK